MTITVPEALDLARYAMMVTLQMAAPILLIGMFVGLLISLLQAVTQIQEQTLSFIPKMLAMAAAVVVFAPWISSRMMEFARDMLGNVSAGH
ncbi:MAG: flagellar biosynthesis protein FliQ [Phycisphaerae bacterium]|nr:flagellar biosynthesis protein FliQ [Phycisphaerae bacterium]